MTDGQRLAPILTCTLLLAALLRPEPADAGGKHARLIKALSDPSFKVRLQAAIVIGKHEIKEAAPALRRSLGDEHEAVQAAALVSLGRLGDQESRTHMVQLLNHRSKLVARASEKSLILLDKALPRRPAYLLSIARPKLPAGVASSRALRLIRVFRKRLEATEGVVASAGEEDVLHDKELAAHLRKRRLMGMLLQPRLSKLTAEDEGGRTVVYATVNIMLSTLVDKRLEFSAGGEANAWIEGDHVSEDERLDLETEVIQASADAAITQVLQYLAGR